MAVYDFSGQEYNKKLAEALKQIPEFKKPEWIDFVKSGSGKERPIEEDDFWYKKASSILKQIYKNKIVGVNRLRTRYGNKKRRGSRPEKFKKSGGKIIRTILKQADEAGFTEKVSNSTPGIKRSGRRLTDKGIKFMEEIK